MEREEGDGDGRYGQEARRVHQGIKGTRVLSFTEIKSSPNRNVVVFQGRRGYESKGICFFVPRTGSVRKTMRGAQ